MTPSLSLSFSLSLSVSLSLSGGEEVAQFSELCYACGSSGILKMVVTNIPHFKEIVPTSLNKSYKMMTMYDE